MYAQGGQCQDYCVRHGVRQLLSDANPASHVLAIRTLTRYRYHEVKAQAGMCFDLVAELEGALNRTGQTEPLHEVLDLLYETTRREVHFILRHPEALFQCVWNAWREQERETHRQNDSAALTSLLHSWRAAREKRDTRHLWIEALATPVTPLHAGQVVRLIGHLSDVGAVAYSTDRRRIATGSADDTVRIWDSATGTELACFAGQMGGVEDLAFSPDSRSLVLVGTSNEMRIIDSHAGYAIQRFHNLPPDVVCARFLSDGCRLASGSFDGAIRIWDARSATQLYVMNHHQGCVRSLAVTAAGALMATGADDCTVGTCDVAERRLLWHIETPACPVYSLDFSPDGRLLAGASPAGSLKIWNSESGDLVRDLSAEGVHPTSVAFSHGGGWLAVGFLDGAVRVWDVTSGEVIASYEGNSSSVNRLAFAHSDRHLVSTTESGEVRIWDALRTPRSHPAPCHKEVILCSAYHKHGHRLVTVSRDDRVCIWDTQNGANLNSWSAARTWLYRATVSQRHDQLAVMAYDGTVRTYELSTGRELWICTLRNGPATIGIAADGQRVWVSYGKGEVFELDGESGQILQSWNLGPHNCVSRSHDGLLYATGAAGLINLWNAQTGQPLSSIRIRDQAEVRTVAFSRNTRRLVSVSGDVERRDDFITRIFGVASGRLLGQFKGSGDPMAIAEGPRRFPWRALSRGAETVIENAATGGEVAWFPQVFDSIVTHTSGRSWAGTQGPHLYLITLKGVEQM